jgi:hypothetical protein
MQSAVYDAAGHRRSPVTMPGFHEGRVPRNKGRRYPADPPTNGDCDPSPGGPSARESRCPTPSDRSWRGTRPTGPRDDPFWPKTNNSTLRSGITLASNQHPRTPPKRAHRLVANRYSGYKLFGRKKARAAVTPLAPEKRARDARPSPTPSGCRGRLERGCAELVGRYLVRALARSRPEHAGKGPTGRTPSGEDGGSRRR